jgi:hypothetical protein
VFHKNIGKVIEPTISLSQAMLDVQNHVQEVEKLPSCKRIASKKLIHSCVSFDSLRSDLPYEKDTSLESFRNLFALRMTHCELADADIPMPRICSPLLDPTLDDEFPAHLLTECLHSMHAIPSSWDSFNHAKTRGAIMCHAMRSEIDKDEQLQLFKLLFSTVSSVVTSVGDSNLELQKAHEFFSELRASMRDFYVQLQSDTEQAYSKASESWTEIEVRLQDDMRDVTQNIRVVVQALHEADARLNVYSQSVEDKLRSDQKQATDMALSRREELLHLQEEIEARRDWLAYQTELALQNFTNGIYGVTRDLNIANELSGNLAARLHSHAAQLDSQIGQMHALHETTAAFNIVQSEQHGRLLHQLDEMASRSSETLEALQAASEYALQWEGIMKTIFGFVQGNLLLRLTFYFVLFFFAALLFSIWAEVPCLMAMMTAIMAGSGKI